MSATRRTPAEPWRIHFFRRHDEDDPRRNIPAREYLDSVPTKVAAEIIAILDAVAKAPPPAFSGGGKFEAMRGDMAGIFEVRTHSHRANHRVFCLLVRDLDLLGGPGIVLLGGLTKELRQAAHPREYELIRRYADEFRKRGCVREPSGPGQPGDRRSAVPVPSRTRGRERRQPR